AFKRETQLATQAIKDQHEELRAQTDPVFAFQRALRDVRAAQADWTDATKKHGPKSDEAREAALRLFEAVTDLNGAAGDVSGTFKGEWTPEMQAAAVAAGLTEDQIADLKRIVEDTRTAAEDYATTWGKVPKEVGPKVTTPGLDPAIAKARELVTILDKVPANVQIRVGMGQVVGFA